MHLPEVSIAHLLTCGVIGRKWSRLFIANEKTMSSIIAGVGHFIKISEVPFKGGRDE